MSEYYRNKQRGLELFNVMCEWDLSVWEANVLKYVVRAGRKPSEDPKVAANKALAYASMALERYYENAVADTAPVSPRDVAEAFELSPVQSAIVHALNDVPHPRVVVGLVNAWIKELGAE